MCGIAGLFSKSSDVEENLGAHLSAMLGQLADRGPDSAGVAFYRDPAPIGSCKVSLFSPDEDYPWHELHTELSESFGEVSDPEIRATHALFVVGDDGDQLQRWLPARHPELRVMSVGERIEIYKEAGDPRDFVVRFGLDQVSATHALGHTRMATESRVTTEHSHPFSTGLDLCLVHNGSLSNHNRLRVFLRGQGI
jgi:glutamate synthase domain-containing protein 1